MRKTTVHPSLLPCLHLEQIGLNSLPPCLRWPPTLALSFLWSRRLGLSPLVGAPAHSFVEYELVSNHYPPCFTPRQIVSALPIWRPNVMEVSGGTSKCCSWAQSAWRTSAGIPDWPAKYADQGVRFPLLPRESISEGSAASSQWPAAASYC